MSLELRAERDDDGWRLLAPDAGLFTCALPRGAALAPGQRAGVLIRLGRQQPLVVPAGVAGLVASQRPERVHAPVGYGALLYRLRHGSGMGDGPADAPGEAGGLMLRAAGSGRFYQRPAPDEPAFVEPGALLQEGSVVGLIEVMKTFAHVTYRAAGGLPARARVVRLVAEDGADVASGDPLIEVVGA